MRYAALPLALKNKLRKKSIYLSVMDVNARAASTNRNEKNRRKKQIQMDFTKT